MKKEKKTKKEDEEEEDMHPLDAIFLRTIESFSVAEPDEPVNRLPDDR